MSAEGAEHEPIAVAADSPSSEPRARPFKWKTNLLLFLATVVSVFRTGAEYVGQAPHGKGVVAWLRALPNGYEFAVPLLSILLVHEFAHYFAARRHHVEASLPYFIPMPYSPFGTMGAVISMRGQIRSRDALLDIGASGPLAGLCVAIPVLVYGIARSPIIVMSSPGTQEGQSILYLALKYLILGPIPKGHDIAMSPTAFAGWVGIFVTMLNLIPIWQLDGGHVAYAMAGPRQNRIARVLHWSLLAIFAYNMIKFAAPVVAAALATKWTDATTEGVEQALGNSLFWLFWFAVLRGMMWLSGSRDHPPTEATPLSFGRQCAGALALVFFILLFMPTPWSTY